MAAASCIPDGVDLESRIRPKDDASIILESRRGEEATLKHYRRALDRDLPEAVRDRVDKQYIAIQQVLQQLRAI